MLPKLPLIVDRNDDHDQLLNKTFEEKGLPEIIKTAAVTSSAAGNDTDFGLVLRGPTGNQYKYPLMDAGNALASALYFGEYGAQLPAAFQKTASAQISQALTAFGYDPPGDLVKIAADSLAEQRMSDELAFADMFGFDEDDQFEQLEGAFDGLSPRGKIRMAMTVKEASVTVGHNFLPAIDIRKMHLKTEEDLEELNGIKAKVASVTAVELAAELYQFDLDKGLTHLYHKHIPDAADSVFNSDLIKQAAPGPVEIDGREYTADTIGSFAGNRKDTIVDAFGEDFYEQFSGSPRDVLDSLPITHKQALARMMDA